MVEKDRVMNNINYIFRKYSGKEELEHEVDRLRSHIVELELDVKTANKRYEKSMASEKKAIAAKQDAEEKLKASEVRLLTLEHELERQRTENTGQLNFTRTDQLVKQQAEDFILSLSSIKHPSESLITVYVASGGNLENMRDYGILAERINSETLAMLEKINSSNGLVLFYSVDHLVNELLVPPLPLKGSCWTAGNTFDTAPLLELLRSDSSMCVLVAHAGESFVGFSIDSGDFDSFQVIKSSVKAKHAKGGFSQRRFERLRDEDIAHHVDKVKLALRDMLEEYEGNIDCLVLAGDLQLAREIAADAPLDIEQVFSSSDVRIEKHKVSEILNQIMVYRRYRF